MLHDANFYVLISFLGFIFLAVFYGYKYLSGLIEEKIKEISQEIKGAKSLKEQAVEDLNMQTRAINNIQQEIDLITKNAHEQVAVLMDNFREELAEEIAEKQRDCEATLKKIRTQFKHELQDYITDWLTKALVEWVQENGNTVTQHQSHAYAINLLSQTKLSAL